MKTYTEAVKALFYWQYSYTGCFSDKLYDLFAKADAQNRSRLTMAFPSEGAAWADWESAANGGDDLFTSMGLKKP